MSASNNTLRAATKLKEWFEEGWSHDYSLSDENVDEINAIIDKETQAPDMEKALREFVNKWELLKDEESRQDYADEMYLHFGTILSNIDGKL
jgi:hypothetical protein